jgi:hypothetical protein
MASGHVNRINRPNTWPHRPAAQREDSPCQPGAVHTWHKLDALLGGTFAGRQPKPFGAFLIQMRHRVSASYLPCNHSSSMNYEI